MRSTPGVPLTIAELQLSSPLPSPSRQSVLNNHAHTLSTIINNKSSSSSLATNSYNSTPDLASISTLSKSMMLPPLQFEQPNTLHLDLYPLTTANTPKAMKKFTFLADGRPCLFEEVNVWFFFICKFFQKKKRLIVVTIIDKHNYKYTKKKICVYMG